MNFTTNNFSIKKRKIITLLFFINVFFNLYSQNPYIINLSPNGTLENVFDQYGKHYNLSDLLINNQPTSSNFKTELLSCDNSTSYFNLYFEDGSGMETVTDPNQNAINSARRAVVCKVFEDISNFINSPLTNPLNTTKVNIWVRNINNVYANPNGILGMASAFYNVANNATNNSSYGGIADNEIWKTIHTGKDSYLNVAMPLTSIGGGTNQSGIFFHGMITINFNANNTPAPFSWNTDLTTASIATTQFDLYTAVLHEVTHALGFTSLIDANGNSKLGSNFKYYSRYDRFLKTNTNKFLLKTNTTCTTMYDYFFDSTISTTVLHPFSSPPCIENTLCNDAIKFVGTTTVPVYTPNCFSDISSLSHFEDALFPSCTAPKGNDAYFLMCNAGNSGIVRRFLKPEERLALCSIGYSVKTTFGTTTTASGFNNYGGTACSGISVAGTNDGLSNTGIYSFTGMENANINISGSIILSNDSNATSFECLQDLTATTIFPTTFSVTTGTTTTNVTFKSGLPGVHLLRYVPKNGTIRGNITYIYVFVKPILTTISCSSTATACNLVGNGDFESNNFYMTQPTNSQFERVCGWYAVGGSSSLYFTPSSVDPWFNEPCNGYGYQTDRITNNSHYAGIQMYTPSSTVQSSGILGTTLSSSLLPNTTYQLKFDVSLGEFLNYRFNQIQAFISSSPPSDIGTSTSISNTIITTGVLLSSANISNSNGWDTLTFTFTTGATTTNMKYLYLGGLNNFSSTIGSTPPILYNGCQNNLTFTSQNASFYYIDNVSLIANDANLDLLPDSICSTTILPNLSDFLTNAPPTGGVFSGSGVILNSGIYSFNPANLAIGVYKITYTFNNNLGCPITISDVITVNAVTPTFASIPPNVCKMGAAPTLPTTSDNGITGTWSPSTVNTTVAGTFSFTFTPSGTQCATVLTKQIIIKNPVKPTFDELSTTSANTICEGSDPPLLPTVSLNNFSGTWNPAVVSSAASGNYQFTPSLGQCASQVNVSFFVLLDNAFAANDDTFNVFTATTAVATPSVSFNDTYNGGPIPPNEVIFGVNTMIPWDIIPVGTPPTIANGDISFDTTTGIFTIAPGTTPGTYIYYYDIATGCHETDPATVTIIVNPPISSPSRTAFTFCYKNNGTTSSSASSTNITSLYYGVTASGQPLVPGTATITTTPAVLPISINQYDGTFTIPGGTLPQIIQFYYTVTINGSTSESIRCAIQINSTLQANNDNVTFNSNGSGTYNVLSNDWYFGDCSATSYGIATTSNVTVTQVAPFSNYYSINSVGAIVANGIIPSGTYILSYKICDNVYPGICQTATVTVTVPSTFAPITSPVTSKKAIEHFNLEEIVISPNPTNNIVTINFNEAILNNYTIELYDLLGRPIIQKQIAKGSLQFELNLENYSSGNYILRISDDESEFTFHKTITKL